MRNFVTLLESSASRHAGRPAIVGRDGVLAHGGLHRRAGGVARVLAESGVRPGDRVALSLPNGWEFAAAFLGTLKLGAVVAPLDPRLTADERRLPPAELLAEREPGRFAAHPAVDPERLPLFERVPDRRLGIAREQSK